MGNMPPFFSKKVALRSICLILEGYEEWFYFDRLMSLSVFSSNYKIRLINAKGAGNIPAKYHEALASDSYSIILIVCDMDRTPEAYDGIVAGIEEIIGDNKAHKIITFTRPCTLQIILLHFGNVELKTQKKAAARDDVLRLTGVSQYNAHQEQLRTICQKISYKNWSEMRESLKLLSSNPSDTPSSNIYALFEHLCSDDFSWIDSLNKDVFAE